MHFRSIFNIHDLRRLCTKRIVLAETLGLFPRILSLEASGTSKPARYDAKSALSVNTSLGTARSTEVSHLNQIEWPKRISTGCELVIMSRFFFEKFIYFIDSILRALWKIRKRRSLITATYRSFEALGSVTNCSLKVLYSPERQERQNAREKNLSGYCQLRTCEISNSNPTV